MSTELVDSVWMLNQYINTLKLSYNQGLDIELNYQKLMDSQ